MSEKITGVVEDIQSRTVNGKNGAFTAYDYHIDGQKYGAGSFSAKGVGVGDTVEFTVEYNGNYKNIAKNSMRKVAAGAAPARQEAAPSTAVYTGKTVNQKQEEKDARISKQSAFNTALSFLTLAHNAGALPKLEGKGAQGFGFLKTLFFKEAAALYQEATGEAWDLQAPDIDVEAGKVPAKPKKAVPAPVVEPEPEVADDDWNDQINF